MLFNFQVYFFTVRPKDVQKRPLLSCFEPSELYNLALSKDNMANWTCNWNYGLLHFFVCFVLIEVQPNSIYGVTS